MKPKTFGKDRQKPGGPSSLPGSHSGSPVRQPPPGGTDTPTHMTRDDIQLPQNLDVSDGNVVSFFFYFFFMYFVSLIVSPAKHSGT